jgi:hypothetical protein
VNDDIRICGAFEKEKNMRTIQIFDKPMCCSSGVCGPDVDPALVTFSADLQWLESQGVQVQRVNPAHQPALFAANELVRQELQINGSECLPVIVVDKTVVSRGVTPNRQQLATWMGITVNELPVVSTGCCGGERQNDSTAGCCKQE